MAAVATYRITRELESAAFFPITFEVGNLSFLTVGGRDSGRIHVSGPATGEEFRPALERFEHDVRVVLDAFAIAPLVGISSYGRSVLVEKEGTSVAWFYSVQAQRDVVTITDMQPYVYDGLTDVIVKLNHDERLLDATRHFRESLLYSSALVSTIHLLRAVEALAGVRPSKPKCPACTTVLRCAECGHEPTWPRTDLDAVKSILGAKTFKFFYRNPGVRNRLMHGLSVDQQALSPQLAVMRGAVQDDLRARLGLGAPFLDRVRSPWAFRAGVIWLDKGDGETSLETLITMAVEQRFDSGSFPRPLMPEEVEALRDQF